MMTAASQFKLLASNLLKIMSGWCITIYNYFVTVFVMNGWEDHRRSQGWDVVIFHLHTILNSLHILHVLSHSTIALQRVQAPYHNVTLKLTGKKY